MSSQLGRTIRTEQRLAGLWAALLATGLCIMVATLIAALSGAGR